MMHRRLLVSMVLVLGAAACSATAAGPAAPTTSTTAASSSSTTTTAPAKETGSTVLGTEARPARLVAPDEVTDPAPLLVVLHGWGSSAERIDSYLGITQLAASRGLYVLLPNGEAETTGKQFWNAGPACCNFTGVVVDDVAYLGGLIDEAIAARPIDPDRVYVLGHSNGGFMAYRLACDLADKVTAIASLAGMGSPTAAQCQPSRPVSVLHLHGTADGTIAYAGGRITDDYPGAVETVTRWAALDGCDATPVAGPNLDLEGYVPGAETTVSTYVGCASGTEVQLDSIQDGVHSPYLPPAAVGTDILDWLLARSR